MYKCLMIYSAKIIKKKKKKKTSSVWKNIQPLKSYHRNSDFSYNFNHMLDSKAEIAYLQVYIILVISAFF